MIAKYVGKRLTLKSWHRFSARNGHGLVIRINGKVSISFLSCPPMSDVYYRDTLEDFFQ